MITMKASFRLISADTLIKQTHLGHAGKKFVHQFYELTEAPAPCL